MKTEKIEDLRKSLSIFKKPNHINSQQQNMFDRLGLTPEEIKKYRRIVREAKHAPKWFIPLVKLNVG